MSPLPPVLLGVLVMQSAVSGSRAETEIVCAGPLPFSQTQMEQALHTRRHLLGGASSVVVRAEGGHTLVQVGDAQREVDLGGLAGEEAARMVAVLALDLAQADAPLPFASSSSSTSSSTLSSTPASKAPRPPPVKSERAFRAGLALLSPFDQTGWVAHLEPTLDVSFGAARGLGVFGTAGYRQVSDSGVGAGTGTTSLGMRELPVRAGVSYRRRWFELRLGAMARFRVVDGAGSHLGATWGAVIAGATHWRLTPRLAVLFAAGVDVSRNRMVFNVGDETVLSTSWFAPWLGVGLAWETAL